MKKLFYELKPYSFVVALSLSLLLISKLAANAIPKIIQQAVDGPIAKGDFNGLYYPVLCFLCLRIFSFIAMFFQGLLSAHTSQNIIKSLRIKLFMSILNRPYSYFSKTPVGKIISRIVNDTETLNEFFSTGIINIFGDLVTIIIILCFMLSLNIKMTFVSILILPIVLWTSYFFKERLRKLFGIIRIKTADMNGHLQESLSGLKITQLFNREKEDAEKFNNCNLDYFNTYKKIIHNFALFHPLTHFLGSVALTLILWYGGVSYFEGFITPGILFAFITYTEELFNPIRDLAEKYGLLQNAVASSERVFGLLEEQTEITQIQNLALPEISSDNNGSVSFNKVSFSYLQGVPVLSALSFNIDNCQTVAIVGPSGAGKSTIISLINRLYKPDCGAIFVNGKAINSISLDALHSTVVTISQDLYLFTSTIFDNITLGNSLISRDQVICAAKTIGIHDFIESLPNGYNTILAERGSNLSTGQKQLLLFVRALVRNPPLLILDEATSNIDPYTEQLIQKAIKILTKGRSCLIIAHRLSTIKDADKIIVLSHGQLEEEGTDKELREKNGLYNKLHKLQFS